MLPVALVIVYGLPGAGKSSLCSSLLRSNLGFSDGASLVDGSCHNTHSVQMKSAETCVPAHQLSLVTIDGTGKEETSTNVSVDSGRNARTRFVHVCFDSLIPSKDQELFAAAAKSLQETEPSDPPVQFLGSTESDQSALWKKARKDVFSKVEKFLCQVRHCMQDDSSLNYLVSSCDFHSNTLTCDKVLPTSLVILLDDNFYYRSMRQPYYALAGAYEAGFCEVLVRCSVEEALERNSHRHEGAKVPSDVIKRMALRMEYAAPFSHSWEQQSLEIASHGDNSLDRLEVLHLIQSSLSSPVVHSDTEESRQVRAAAASASRIVCSRSVLHQADLLLRQFVAETAIKCGSVEDVGLLTSGGHPSVKELMKQANAVRQAILKEMKVGRLGLPQCLSEEFTPDVKLLLSDFLRSSFSQKMRSCS